MESTSGRWPAIAVGVASTLAGGFVATAWVSRLLDARPPGWAVGVAVGTAFAVSLAAPTGLAMSVGRALRGRGYALPFPWTWGGVVFLVNLAIVVGVQVGEPAGVVPLLRDRATWVPDALLGRGPFGSAAAPGVLAALRTLSEPLAVDQAAPLVCDDAARAAAKGMLAEARAPSPVGAVRAAALDAVAVRAEAGSGRAALQSAADLVSGGIGDALLTLPVPGVATLAAAERTALVFEADGASLTARYEDGAWRVCVDPVAAEAAGRAAVSEARDRALAAVPKPPEPDPAEVAARQVVRAAARGRTGWALGIPADPGFSVLFTGRGAVAEAERIRGWCRALAVGDPASAGRVAELDARWASTPDRLPTEGVALLADVEAACAPVAASRVLVESARGLPGTAAERRRWADLDAISTSESAVFVREDTGLRATVQGLDGAPASVWFLVPAGAGWLVDAVR